MTLQILSTPEHAFSNLKDYPFTANYLTVEGMKMHYLDEGNLEDPVIFLLHGQPSWSYLYRHMIPQFVAGGYRVIAPDLIGFGKSDKPINPAQHSYQNHVNWLDSFVKQLGIRHAAAFMQDWGGMIGLRVLAQQPEWLDRLILANTALAETSKLEQFILPKVLKILAFKAGRPTLSTLRHQINYGNWASYFRYQDKLDIGEVIQTLTVNNLDQQEKDAYNAPYPSAEFYAGPRTMPQIVATDLKQVNRAWRKLKQWDKPVLTLFSDRDPFLSETDYHLKFQNNFSGAHTQPHSTIKGASHFLQEDQPEQLVTRVMNWLSTTHFHTH